MFREKTLEAKKRIENDQNMFKEADKVIAELAKEREQQDQVDHEI